MKLSRTYGSLSSSLSPARGANKALSHHGSATRKRLGRGLLMFALLVMSLAINYQTAHAVFLIAPSTETIIGVTNNNELVVFYSTSPQNILSSKPITGLANGEFVLGIDYRPVTGQLYGFTRYNRLVTINVATGEATPIATVNPSLAGNAYGVDFNPTVDRLRIVNDTDQNASVNPDTAAAILQTPLNPGNPNIVGVAYTNNFAGATTTTLYDIDSATDTLYIQSPPASGTLIPVGPLGVNTTNLVGFDISGSSGIAYASLTQNGTNYSEFYSIDLNTGLATLHGQIGSNGPLVAMAISPVLPPTVFAVTTSERLISFNSARPDIILSSTPITGLANGETVLAIDFRPATGQLYGFTRYNSVITINTATGAITRLGSTNLAGNAYGFDFNPVPDRIRIVNDTDQNIRVNPDTGAVAATDSPLAYAAGDPNAGQNPNIVGAAYSNNTAGATSTTLYDIDSNLDILTTQGGLNSNPSPNTGQLFTVGPLGVNTTNQVGFDIANGTGAAFASLTPTGTNTSNFYSINLATGAATLLGQIGNTPTQVRGIAVSTIPAPTIIGLTADGLNLVRFNSNSPQTVSSPTPITGLLANEFVIAIDYRPATGQLYGFTRFNSVIIIDPATGAITRVGSTNLAGNFYGMDFNPVPDRLRIVNDTDQNIRFNPNDGTFFVDGTLAYAPGDPNNGQNPNIAGAAYTNSFAGATSTTLYDIDFNLDILTTQNPPNAGTLNTVGPLGFNTSGLVGFDIAPENNAAYASLQPAAGGQSQLYSINLSTGLATFMGTIGGSQPLLGIAIVPSGTIQFATTGATVTEGTDFSVTIPVTRTGNTSTTATVNYTTQNGTASAGSDYLSTSGTLTFNPGETTKNIVVSLLNDAPPEPTETFTVRLSNPTGGFSIGAPSTFVVTILDND